MLNFLVKLYKCYVLPLHFYYWYQDIELFEGVQRISAKRLCSLRLFHLKYEAFCFETLDGRVKLGFISLCNFIYGFYNLNTSNFVTSSFDTFNIWENGLRTYRIT